MVGRSRVFYLFLMKDIGRWLPWVLPGSAERFHKDDVRNHSAHGYYSTRMEGGVSSLKKGDVPHAKSLINTVPGSPEIETAK